MDNKKIYNIIAVSGILLLLIVFLFEPVCLFKKFIKIPCPGCGLTRAFFSIMKFNFTNAFNYNVLSIPIFVFAITYYLLYILYLFDINYLDKYYNFFVKRYYIIISFIVFSWIINIVKYM